MNKTKEEYEEQRETIKSELLPKIEKFQMEILKKQSEIRKLISDCEDLSEEYGFPFYGIGPLEMNYAPNLKYNQYDLDVLNDVLSDFECSTSDWSYGWEHSAVC
jgi:hypothetical protein